METPDRQALTVRAVSGGYNNRFERRLSAHKSFFKSLISNQNERVSRIFKIEAESKGA